jgi:hypothetical protein
LQGQGQIRRASGHTKYLKEINVSEVNFKSEQATDLIQDD